MHCTKKQNLVCLNKEGGLSPSSPLAPLGEVFPLQIYLPFLKTVCEAVLILNKACWWENTHSTELQEWMSKHFLCAHACWLPKWVLLQNFKRWVVVSWCIASSQIPVRNREPVDCLWEILKGCLCYVCSGCYLQLWQKNWSEPGSKGIIVKLQVNNPYYCSTSISVSSLTKYPSGKSFLPKSMKAIRR